MLIPRKADGRVCALRAVAEERLAPLQGLQLAMAQLKPELCSVGQPLQQRPPAPMVYCRGCARLSQGEFGAERQNWAVRVWEKLLGPG